MLRTKLQHIETEEEYRDLLRQHPRVILCCGRMGPMCIPVYLIMQKLEDHYPDVAFRDMDFDIPAADLIRRLPECAGFMGLPFTVYYHNGRVVAATTSIQDEDQIRTILDREFGAAG
ncbi:MAG: thioredoxin family protein [Spirochaetes bacterium]|nr:thioredoxin family protein [Spirochaetota bacterium]